MNDTPYSLPEIYETAFSFRDYPKTVDSIIAICAKAGLSKIHSTLELGCGPGQYCREFARRKIQSFGIDLSSEMVSYVKARSADEQIDCTGIEADMRSFKLTSTVQLAVCMMATFEHLLSNDDVIEHFASVADNLTKDGLYLIELSHPRDFLTGKSSTRNDWTIEKDGRKVTTVWGAEGSLFDPLTEISEVRVTYTVEHDGRQQLHESTTRTRHYSAGLIHALVSLSGRFAIAAMYGDLDVNQPFDNSDKSWRMVLVLRKLN